MEVKVKNFRPFQKGALQGYLDLELSQPKWTIKGCTVFESNGRSWVSLPTRPYKDEKGEQKYANIIEMSPEDFKLFMEQCLNAYKEFSSKTESIFQPPVTEMDIPF